MKKLLAGLLAALMIFSAAPMTGLAAQAEEQNSAVSFVSLSLKIRNVLQYPEY